MQTLTRDRARGVAVQAVLALPVGGAGHAQSLERDTDRVEAPKPRGALVKAAASHAGYNKVN